MYDLAKCVTWNSVMYDTWWRENVVIAICIAKPFHIFNKRTGILYVAFTNNVMTKVSGSKGSDVIA